MVHAMPRLSPWSRLLLVERVQAGRPAAHVAAEMGVSRATAYKWLRRYRVEGADGLVDRPSRPLTSPTRTRDRHVAPGPPPGAGPDRRHPQHAGLDRAP